MQNLLAPMATCFVNPLTAGRLVPLDAEELRWRLSAPVCRARARQRGLTLVELMVAMVIGLVIVVASTAALLAARRGFTAVDASSQLRENTRFAVDILQRIVAQAGFEDVAGGHSSTRMSEAKPAALRGYDNAIVKTPDDLPNGVVSGSRTARCGSVTDTSCLNGSDVLMVRYWGVSTAATPAASAAADGSIINCAGVEEPSGTDRAYSIFHVKQGASGEPSLFCTYLGVGGLWVDQPLVSGVEGLQVLYGRATNVDGVADQYVHAAELQGANAAATETNWQLVRSVRIGLLLRGPVGSAQGPASSPIGVLGQGFQGPADEGAQLAVADDRRLRQQLVLTVYLRNPPAH
jgi:type IV pilus assembly protein PilW